MRVLLVLLGIPALLIGLMAMHILSPESEPAPASYSMVESAEPSADCDPACSTLHDVVTFACVLALALGLFFVLPVGRAAVAVSRRVLLAHPARSQRPHAPLSLELLSISRT